MSLEVADAQLGLIFPTLDSRSDIKDLYTLADIRSRGKTIHDLERHGKPVMRMGLALVAEIERFYPGTFTRVEKEYSVPIACQFHDLCKGMTEISPDGSVTEVHHIQGAIEMDRILAEMDVPQKHRRLVSYPIRYHRTSGVLREHGLEMPDCRSDEERSVYEACLRTLAILVLADKCVGDRERVRDNKVWWISMLRWLGLSRVWFHFAANQDSRNNFATYAIQQAKLSVDPLDCYDSPKGAIVLNLVLDERVCSLQQILQVDWFYEAFQCCAEACKYLGFSFRIATYSSPDVCAVLWTWSAGRWVKHN
ncbi:MAG: HD domain-containing protein [Candidatus Obscuribacterales bacterium]